MVAGTREVLKKESACSQPSAVVGRLKLALGSGDEVLIVAVVRAETAGTGVAVLAEFESRCKNMASSLAN